MLHMKQLNSKKTRFPWYEKILVIEPIEEVYGEDKERQLCFRRLASRWWLNESYQVLLSELFF